VAKCSLCGSSVSKKNISARLESLRLSRSPKVLKIIDQTIDKLAKHWDIEDVDVAGFLSEIDKIDDNIVIESINKFNNRGGADQGYNIKYLSAIIKNENKRFAIRQEFERKTLDRIPPKLKD
tara:strand:- start:6 stop:371 length:366 start_codon:yes stop_codon:yes gene_type:complete